MVSFACVIYLPVTAIWCLDYLYSGSDRYDTLLLSIALVWWSWYDDDTRLSDALFDDAPCLLGWWDTTLPKPTSSTHAGVLQEGLLL